LVEILAQFTFILTTVLTIAIIFRAILTWFPLDPYNPLIQVLFQVTEPVLAPIRQFVPRFGMLDLSPLIAIIILQVIGSAVASNLT
jgi:YggT family protein